jgi:hypothetical protein
MKTLHLHIDRIVVEGLPEANHRQFLSALETQLHELAEGGIANQFSGNTRKRLQSIDAGQLRPGASPAQVAAQVANAIRQTMNPSAGTSKPTTTRGGEARTHV